MPPPRHVKAPGLPGVTVPHMIPALTGMRVNLRCNILIAILFEVVNSPLWARSREEGLMGQRAHLKIAWYEVPGRVYPLAMR